ncbi:dihydroorotate dehydrogenase [Candidatus Poribacteria bacterium]
MEVKQESSIDLCVDLAGIQMKNPVMVASGTFGCGEEYDEFIDLRELGAIVTKSVTLLPRAGNPPPRIVETPAGMLNAIGLQNVGLERFISEKMPFLRKVGVPVIASISGKDIREYVELAAKLSEVEGIAGLEVNISCPNVSQGGMMFGADPRITYGLVEAVRNSTRLPLIAKLSPNVTDIVKIASAAKEAGADILSLINTLLGMAIDIHTRQPKLGNVTGGLSGPAIRPVALRMVWQVSSAVGLPIIGMGGIMTAEDALEFMIAGARAVAVGTANFVNPLATMEIISGIKDFMFQNHISNLDELVGGLQKPEM